MGGQKECESFLLCVHYFYLLLTHLKKMKIGRGQITSLRIGLLNAHNILHINYNRVRFGYSLTDLINTISQNH